MDLEDIIIGDIREAYAHHVFKLCRESIRLGWGKLNQVRDLCFKQLMSGLNSLGFEIGLNEFNWWMHMRNFSDIHLILDRLINQNDNSLCYDLNKKIHHSVEIELLIGKEV